MSTWEQQDGSEESARSCQCLPLAASSAQSPGFLSWYKGAPSFAKQKNKQEQRYRVLFRNLPRKTKGMGQPGAPRRGRSLTSVRRSVLCTCLGPNGSGPGRQLSAGRTRFRGIPGLPVPADRGLSPHPS